MVALWACPIDSPFGAQEEFERELSSRSVVLAGFGQGFRQCLSKGLLEMFRTGDS